MKTVNRESAERILEELEALRLSTDIIVTWADQRLADTRFFEYLIDRMETRYGRMDYLVRVLPKNQNSEWTLKMINQELACLEEIAQALDSYLTAGSNQGPVLQGLLNEMNERYRRLVSARRQIRIAL